MDLFKWRGDPRPYTMYTSAPFGAETASPFHPSYFILYLRAMSPTTPDRKGWLRPRRVVQIAAASILVAVLTLVISKLPKFELLQAAMNDDNFTDIVLQTRGELPIDTSIRVLVYDRAIFDTVDRVDRAMLAMRLAALLEMKPAVVAVDFLIEDMRPEFPDGDEMLKALIAANPNLIFGIFHEDSLNRFRIPPQSLAIPDSQLGCINLKEDNDRTIRTYTTIWGEEGKKQFESFDVKVAEKINPSAVDYLKSFSQEEFVIDYAAGIGETKRAEDSTGRQIFPVLPLEAIYGAMMSGDTAQQNFFREMLQGKAVLVGYGDLRSGQVESIVDRFYTPFKPEKNSLPDMHGVAIHANIVNTILQQRVLQIMPLWANLIWGAFWVFLLLLGREWLDHHVKKPTLRTILNYSGFAAFFVVGALLPVLAFRYTPFKFSIYAPLAGLLLAVPTSEALERGVGLFRDFLRRRRLRSLSSVAMRDGMRGILRTWSVSERLQRGLHFLQLQFNACCSVLFHEASHNEAIRFQPTTVASPSMRRMIPELAGMKESLAGASAAAQSAARLLGLLDSDPLLSTDLQFSRSLYIALNEIRRQSHAAGIDEDLAEADFEVEEIAREVQQSIAEYADLAMKSLSGTSDVEEEDRFDELYRALERYAAEASSLVQDDSGLEELLLGGKEIFPYIFRSRCLHHGVDETFIYFGTQEDANNRDDYFDLVYGGATIRCQPVKHPGLTEFKSHSLRYGS